MTDKLSLLIAEKGYALCDGAIGTNLFAKGLMTGDAPELWNRDVPAKITELHQEFVDAGSDIILTNSFGGTSYRMALHDAAEEVETLNRLAVELARKVADNADRTVLVGGSIGPTGELFIPLGTLDEASATLAFTKQAETMASAGADMLWIETMSSVEEMQAAITAAQSTGLPVCATMTFDTAGRTMMGIQPADFAKQATTDGLNAYGANCGIGPAELLDTIFGFTESGHEGGAIIAKGNCGIPAYDDGKIHYHGTPELMADYAIAAYRAGARIIGGCCGTTPAHITAMATALSDYYDKAPSDEAAFTRQMAAEILGKPWANVPEKPATTSKSKRRRRRDA